MYEGLLNSNGQLKYFSIFWFNKYHNTVTVDITDVNDVYI